jgi:hypothetical protein
MLRNRLLPVVRLVSPIVAAALLLPSTALAQEALAQPIPGQTPAVRVEPPQAQQQGPTAQTQTQPANGAAGPQAQSQTFTPTPGTFPVGPGGINMQPQIQVLVQPQIQVSAQPQGNASPQADSNINANVTPTVTTTPTVTQNGTVSQTPTVTTTSQPDVFARPYTPPYQQYPQMRPNVPAPRVVTRVVSQPGPHKPYKVLKPLPRRKGLMITGWIVFGVSYLLTASNAADLYDRCPGMSNPDRCRDLAKEMFIPIAGPFMAMDKTKYATDDYSLAVSGTLQSAGLLMAIIGTSQFVRDGRRNRIINEYGLRVSRNASISPSSPALGGGGLTLRARF